MIENVMAEFTVRSVRENGQCQVQLVTTEGVVAAGKWQPVGLYGTKLYLDLFEKALHSIKDESS